MSGISTHILDVGFGKPAANVKVKLEKMILDSATDTFTFELLSKHETNQDGRVQDLLGKTEKQSGTYRLTFEVKQYFQSTNRPSFYPRVQLEFEITDTENHHHVPLLLNTYGFTTYRGS